MGRQQPHGYLKSVLVHLVDAHQRAAAVTGMNAYGSDPPIYIGALIGVGRFLQTFKGRCGGTRQRANSGGADCSHARPTSSRRARISSHPATSVPACVWRMTWRDNSPDAT